MIEIIFLLLGFAFGGMAAWRLIEDKHSKEFNRSVEAIRAQEFVKEIDMGGGIVYTRPYRIGDSQTEKKTGVFGHSKLRIIEHDECLEIYGAWDRNGKNEIDPFTLFLPLGQDGSGADGIIELGEFLVDYGNKLSEQAAHNN